MTRVVSLAWAPEYCGGKGHKSRAGHSLNGTAVVCAVVWGWVCVITYPALCIAQSGASWSQSQLTAGWNLTLCLHVLSGEFSLGTHRALGQQGKEGWYERELGVLRKDWWRNGREEKLFNILGLLRYIERKKSSLWWGMGWSLPAPLQLVPETCSWGHQAEACSASTSSALSLLLEPSQVVSARAGWSCSERGKISTVNLTQNITDLEEQLPGTRQMNDLSKAVLTLARVILNIFFLSGWLERLGMLIYVFPILFSIIWATVREFKPLKMCWAKLRGKEICRKMVSSAVVVGAKWFVTILVAIIYFSVWCGESVLVPYLQWSCM